jgi:hypothetical protein
MNKPTAELYKAIRKLIPGLPPGISSLQLHLSVNSVPMVTVTVPNPDLSSSQVEITETFEIKKVVSSPENRGSRRAEL